MRILSKFFAKEIATFRFEFDRIFETNFKVSVVESGYLGEEDQSWVWSLYYAKILNILGKGLFSENLKNQLENWAERIGSGFGFPLQYAEEMDFLVLDKELQLNDKILNSVGQDSYLLKVFQRQNEIPYIRSSQSTKRYRYRLAYSVIALGQHFINKNKNSAREMSLYILSMRKYYSDLRPFTEWESTIEAPAFAVKDCGEMMKELANELEKVVKDL